MKHQLYKTGDKDVPSQLLDRNGEVCLSMCRICGKTEFDLYQDCKSDREQAIEWWNKLNIHQQNQLYLSYFGCKATDKFPDEIEQIWRKETQQEKRGVHQEPLEGFDEDRIFEHEIQHKKKEDRAQVDFEMLKRTIETQSQVLKVMDGTKYSEKEEYRNFELFFELLSKSSTFAHKAHKELNRLNNK